MRPEARCHDDEHLAKKHWTSHQHQHGRHLRRSSTSSPPRRSASVRNRRPATSFVALGDGRGEGPQRRRRADSLPRSRRRGCDRRYRLRRRRSGSLGRRAVCRFSAERRRRNGECAHGVMPVPTPATLELLKGAPIYSGDIQKELVTPTGAAIVKVLVRSFQARPQMTTREDRLRRGIAQLCRARPTSCASASARQSRHGPSPK